MALFDTTIVTQLNEFITRYCPNDNKSVSLLNLEITLKFVKKHMILQLTYDQLKHCSTQYINNFESLYQPWIKFIDIGNPKSYVDFINLFQTRVEKIDSEVRELSQNDINLKSDYLQVCEIKEVYEKSKSFFDNQSDEIDSRTLLTEDGAQSRGQLGFVAGVIARERIPGFERMLWRVCRGNIFLRRVDIEQPFKDPTTVRI